MLRLRHGQELKPPTAHAFGACALTGGNDRVVCSGGLQRGLLHESDFYSMHQLVASVWFSAKTR